MARKGKAVPREGTAPAVVGAPHSPGPWAEATAAATSRRSPGLSLSPSNSLLPLPRHAGLARPRLHRALSLPPPTTPRDPIRDLDTREAGRRGGFQESEA